MGSVRDYSMRLWEQATRDYNRLVAIDETWYARKVGSYGIPYILFPGCERWIPDRFNQAWDIIVMHAEKTGYEYILSLESDIIPQCDILGVMAGEYEEGLFLIHGHPHRPPRKGFNRGECGCTLASTDLWRSVLDNAPYNNAIYDWFNYGGVYKTKYINVAVLEHYVPAVGSHSAKGEMKGDKYGNFDSG